MGVQLLAAHLTERLPVKKVVFTVIHYPGAAAVCMLGAVAYHSESLGRTASIGWSLACIGIFGLSLGFSIPMWTNLIAKLFPEGTRGKLFSYVFLISCLFGIAGAAVNERLLGARGFPGNFALSFVVAGALMGLSSTAFLWIREPVQHVDEKRRPFFAFVRRLWREAGAQRGFRGLLFARALPSLGAMGAAFYAVAARDRFGLGDEAAASFTMATVAPQIVASIVAGALGDRFGFHYFVPLSPALAALAAWLALTGSSPAAFYAVFALVGYAMINDFVAMTNLAMEYCPKLEKTAFVALVGTATAPFLAAGPLLGGWLAQSSPAGHDLVFRVALGLNLVGTVLIVIFIRDPRKRSGQVGSAEIGSGAPPEGEPRSTARSGQ